MKKQIVLEKKHIAYTLRKSRRARRMRLAVYGGGQVVVTVPYGVSEHIGIKFLKENARWLFSKLEFFSRFPSTGILKENAVEYKKHKQEAFAFVGDRVQYFNNVYGFTYNTIHIKRQKTCWGSCSKKGNLNFNYKILFLPPHVRDYVIIHELCHLKEFNHSHAFWNLVARMAPDYQNMRIDLKNSGLTT